MTRKIDWARVRKAREALEAIAREHPELLAPPSEENRRGWETDLERIMGRPPAFGETTQVAFRLPVELIERLDQHVERMRRQAAGVNISRADAVRHLLSTALEQAEVAEAAPKRKR
jgi:hypothetical protein